MHIANQQYISSQSSNKINSMLAMPKISNKRERNSLCNQTQYCPDSRTRWQKSKPSSSQKSQLSPLRYGLIPKILAQSVCRTSCQTRHQTRLATLKTSAEDQDCVVQQLSLLSTNQSSKHLHDLIGIPADRCGDQARLKF